MPKTKFICQHCGKEFEQWASKYPDGIAKYCSLKCNGLARKNKETESRELIKCDNCGKEFLIYKWHKERDKNHFCSTKCMGEFKTRQVERICIYCGKTFLVRASRDERYKGLYCSQECRSKNLQYNPSDPSFYKTAAWFLIREACLIRDNYTCQKCGKINCTLQVHHIIPRRKGGSDTLDNLVTLCVSCHMKQDSLSK